MEDKVSVGDDLYWCGFGCGVGEGSVSALIAFGAIGGSYRGSLPNFTKSWCTHWTDRMWGVSEGNKLEAIALRRYGRGGGAEDNTNVGVV